MVVAAAAVGFLEEEEEEEEARQLQHPWLPPMPASQQWRRRSQRT